MNNFIYYALLKKTKTTTHISVRLKSNNKPEKTEAYGIDNLFNLVLRPTLKPTENLRIFEKRINEKGWLKK